MAKDIQKRPTGGNSGPKREIMGPGGTRRDIQHSGHNSRRAKKKRTMLTALVVVVAAAALGGALILKNGGSVGGADLGGLIPGSSSGGDASTIVLTDDEEEDEGDEAEAAVTPVTIEKNGYAVTSSSKYATEAGAAVLEAGGNAADAAIAMSYVLGVSEPFGSGIGGGGCMVIYDPASDDYICYDYASEAPQSGNTEYVLVPGMVRGLEAVRKDLGTMEYADLLQYAIDDCDGIKVDGMLAERISCGESYLDANATVYFPNGKLLQEGDTIVQKAMKGTLETLQKEGPECFYTGSIAEAITAKCGLKMSDLAAYEVQKKKALTGKYKSYTVASAPAPFSGVTLIQMLEMASNLGIQNPEENNSAFLNTLKKVTTAAYNDRASYVYDLRFGDAQVDQQSKLTDQYIADLLNMDVSDFVDDDESEDTTGFTVIDANGMAVACTNTLSHFFGSHILVDGFYLNNTGVYFGSGVNRYRPGKRARSHIAPVILQNKNNIVAMASPGGVVIDRVELGVILDMLSFGTAPQTAVEKQRLFFSSARSIIYEIGYSTPALAKVSGSDYNCMAVSRHSYFGAVALTGYNKKGGFYVTEDPRRNGVGKASNG